MIVADDTGGRLRPGKVAIIRAAVAVMGEVGYESASVRDMAARAGVSVAALYYHFPSKHDLLPRVPRRGVGRRPEPHRATPAPRR